MLFSGNKLLVSHLTTYRDFIKRKLKLGNVDNTSDVNKPVSTATQTALDAKLEVVLDSNLAADNILKYDGSDWVNDVLPALSYTTELFSGNDVLTTFSVASEVFSKSATMLHIDGVYQQKGTYDFDSNGDLVFTTAPITGTNNIELLVISATVVGAAGPQGLTGPAGADGANGTNGIDGADGNTILSGSGAPGGGTGVDGDFYINTANDEIYGPKSGGSWGSGTSIVGPQGSQGVKGDTGDTGPQGPAGADGAGTGDVVGPASATDNAIARYDTTTGKLIQNSGVLIDDSDNITGVGTVDGRDIVTDGTKLDGIESGAEVNTINSNPTGITGADQITNIVSMTQAEYDAITPNASTVYIITDA